MDRTRFLNVLLIGIMLFSLSGCIYIWPIPYPTERKSYYICTKKLNQAYQQYQIASTCGTIDHTVLKQARDYWSDAKVDQALQEYECCIDKVQMALDLMVCSSQPVFNQ